MHCRTILLLLFTTLTEAHRPDTLPESELRPHIPPYLLDEDDHTSTERPYTSMQNPFELPPMPYGDGAYGQVHPYPPPPGHGSDVQPYEDYDEYEDEDWSVHTIHNHVTEIVTDVPLTTEDPVETDGTDTTEDDGFEEIDAEHGRLENTTNKNCINWRLVISVTFLMSIISTFLC